MIANRIETFEQNFCFGHEQKETLKVTKQISQLELMNAIHVEYSKQFIKNLCYHLEWVDRIFWAVAGAIQLAYEDISLDQIITSIIQYLNHHRMITPNIGED